MTAAATTSSPFGDALPLAVAGLLNPMIAGAAMALSSAFVVANRLRLRGFAVRVNTQGAREGVFSRP